MMTNEPEWTIVFYVDVQGHSPVEEFIDRLDQKTRTRFGWSIEQLQMRNLHARAPLVKQIEGKLWELREESAGNMYRILYFFYTGRQIVLVHGFQKKTQKTPRREIEIAEKRMIDFIARMEAGE